MPASKNNHYKSPEPVTVVQEPLKDLLVWRSAARPFKQRDREYYTTIAAIVFLLAVILLFLKEWLLIGVIISLGFVAYVLSTVAPEEVENKITTRGVITGGKRYDWSLLGRFWFSTKWGTELLNIETRLTFPARLIIVLGKMDKNKVKTVLEKYLLAERPPKTYIDRAGEWLAKKFPLETA